MQRLRILHRTNVSRFFMTDVKPSLTRLEEELKNQERLFSQKDTKRSDIRERRFPCNVKGPVDRTWFCDGTFYGFIVFFNFPFLKSSLSFYFPASSLVAFMMTSRWLPGLRTIFLRKSPIALPSTLLTVFT